MEYLHTIEAADSAADPTWYTIGRGDTAEQYDGTAASYGREVLQNWINDNPDTPTLDEDGNPTLRILVAFADDPDAFAGSANVMSTVESDDLNAPAEEIAAVEACREDVLRKRYELGSSISQLGASLRTARSAGYRANKLAELAYPAMSRPIVLEAVRNSAPTPVDPISTTKQ